MKKVTLYTEKKGDHVVVRIDEPEKLSGKELFAAALSLICRAGARDDDLMPIAIMMAREFLDVEKTIISLENSEAIH